MDLIWMALYMVRELMAAYPLLSVLIVVVLLLPWVLALWRKAPLKNLRKVWLQAVVLALVCGAVAFFLLPLFFKSGLQHMNYYVDWLFHIGSVASVMVYAWFVAAPLLLLRTRRTARVA